MSEAGGKPGQLTLLQLGAESSTQLGEGLPAGVLRPRRPGQGSGRPRSHQGAPGFPRLPLQNRGAYLRPSAAQTPDCPSLFKTLKQFPNRISVGRGGTRSAPGGQKAHPERGGGVPRGGCRRHHPAMRGWGRGVGVGGANPRTCRRMATPCPQHERTPEKQMGGGGGSEGKAGRKRRMLKASLGPGSALKPAHTSPRVAAALGRSPPFLGPLLVVGILLLLLVSLLLPLHSPPPRLICQRLSPPLAPRQLPSAPGALHSSPRVGVGLVGGGGRRLYLGSSRKVGVFCASPQVQGRGASGGDGAARIGLTSFPLSHPLLPAAFASGSSRGPLRQSPPGGAGSGDPPPKVEPIDRPGSCRGGRRLRKALPAAPPGARFPRIAPV